MNIEIEVEFSEYIEEVDTYVVEVKFDDNYYEVNCQSYLDHDYNETWELSCCNDSGGDIYDSGLVDALVEKYGEDFEYSDEFSKIQCKITDCAEAHKTENTYEAVLLEEHDITATKIESPFNVFYAADTSLYIAYHDDDKVTIFSHDCMKIASALRVLKTFESYDEWYDYENKLWFDEWGRGGHHLHDIAYANFVAKKLGAFEEEW